MAEPIVVLLYGLRDEGVRAFTGLLEAGGASAAGRAGALQAIAVRHVYYPTPRSCAAARESLALFQQLGDGHNASISQLAVGWEAQYDGHADAALAMVADSRQRLGDACSASDSASGSPPPPWPPSAPPPRSLSCCPSDGCPARRADAISAP